MKTLYKFLIIFILLLIIYWLPFLIISKTYKPKIFSKIENLSKSDAIIIFGAHVTGDNKVTPLLKERLDAGIKIYNANKSSRIVVSNTEKPAEIMANYLIDAKVSSSSIEIDKNAIKTTDTCYFEKNNHSENRKTIFVSQGFHLSRLLYQCNKIGINGTAFKAESLSTNDEKYSLFTIISVRSKRYFREAGLTWLAILNIYK